MTIRSVCRALARRWMLLPAVLAVALAACGGCGGEDVFDLSVSGNSVHAALADWEGRHEQYVSTDAGQSWTATAEEPPSDAKRPDCGSDGTCFRVVDLTIEQMTIRGDWEAVWSIPIEREKYVFSKACSAFPIEGTSGYTMRFTTDLVVVDTPQGSVGVVGMGDQGVVVVANDDVSRIGIGDWSSPNDFTGGFTGYEAEALIVVVLSPIAAMILLLVSGFIRLLRPGRRSSRLSTIFISVLIWIAAVLLPFELWARGVLDSYEDTLWIARIAGVVGVIVLALLQPVLNGTKGADGEDVAA